MSHKIFIFVFLCLGMHTQAQQISNFPLSHLNIKVEIQDNGPYYQIKDVYSLENESPAIKEIIDSDVCIQHFLSSTARVLKVKSVRESIAKLEKTSLVDLVMTIGHKRTLGGHDGDVGQWRIRYVHIKDNGPGTVARNNSVLDDYKLNPNLLWLYPSCYVSEKDLNEVLKRATYKMSRE